MDSSGLDDLYHDAILDHCRHPRNRPPLADPDITARAVNPFCGDEIHLQIGLDDDGRAARVGLQGVGCSINQAAGSMLTEAIRGQTLTEVEDISNAFGSMMQGDTASEEEVKALSRDLPMLSSVRRFPVRIKCALLAWTALDDGIEEYRRNHP